MGNKWEIVLRLSEFQQVFYFGFQYIFYMWHSKGGESVKIIGQIYEQTTQCTQGREIE